LEARHPPDGREGAVGDLHKSVRSWTSSSRLTRRVWKAGCCVNPTPPLAWLPCRGAGGWAQTPFLKRAFPSGSRVPNPITLFSRPLHVPNPVLSEKDFEKRPGELGCFLAPVRASTYLSKSAVQMPTPISRSRPMTGATCLPIYPALSLANTRRRSEQ
jgi:hypothetical protein